jgi:hypothetical protein
MEPMIYDEQVLLEKTDEFCALTGRARSGIAAEILNDTKFFDRLESGATCTVRTFNKVYEWLVSNWPKRTATTLNTQKRKEKRT